MGERPTNELLLLLGPAISRGRLEPPAAAWHTLLKRRRVDWEEVGDTGATSEDRPGGLVALVLEGEVVGRGWAAPQGLRLEIPKARAGRLRDVLSY